MRYSVFVKKTWVLIGIILLCGAIPAFYPSLWRGDGDWSHAAGELHSQTVETLRGRLGHALEAGVIDDFATCITQETVNWLSGSGCPYFADSLELQAQCVHDAGLKKASQRIQVDCARTYSPSDWDPLRALFIGDALAVLAASDVSSSEQSAISECAAARIIEAMNASQCKPVALFEGNKGCFNATRRSRELRLALTLCMTQSAQTERQPAKDATE